MRHAATTAIGRYRDLFVMAHNYLRGTLDGVDGEVGRWQPAGNVAPIAAQYVHIAACEDLLVNRVVRRSTPLYATMFAGRTGWQGDAPLTDWNLWARTAAINLGQVEAYARMVFGATEYFLGQANDLLLEGECDGSLLGIGMVPAAAVLNLALRNAFIHTGEIACLKGLQGLVGYPPLLAQDPSPETILSDAELRALFS